ncbi:hypothetical protein [Mucilaginibacter sp.]|uniref:hypothetical protein n=1 Tax=Mucilaginibacter sp. TaxID=1882438 RepID=UPI002623E441|nr:hypothetical protein [Mucilaginibacter sp.]
MRTDNDLYVGQIVYDITGQLNAGLAVTINDIKGNQVEVHWLEGKEKISKIAFTVMADLRPLKKNKEDRD